MDLYGRTKITTDYDVIDRTNVLDVLQKAVNVHDNNVSQIDTLYNYYKGDMDIYNRTKTQRADINNKIVENRCKQIVDFKTSYVVGDPITYSSDNNTDIVTRLNGFCRMENKQTKDYELVEWQNISGTAYRMVQPKDEFNEGESPFTITTIDPRRTFVIYSSGIMGEPMACVYFTKKTVPEAETTYWVYTHERCFVIVNDEISEDLQRGFWELPIVEYPKNPSRIGAFECVIDLIDALNLLDSNRMDGVEQFIQSLMVLVNCRLPEGYTTTDVAQNGLIELISNSDNKASVEILTQQLDQTQTQTLKEDFLSAINAICCMPTRNTGGYGDNGLAVIYRDGWTSAETACKGDQNNITASEMLVLKIMNAICSETVNMPLPIWDMRVDFTRNHYENLEMKTTALLQMLSSPLINPQTAFEVCGLFSDPVATFKLGQEWYEKNNRAETTTEVRPTESTDNGVVNDDVEQ